MGTARGRAKGRKNTTQLVVYLSCLSVVRFALLSSADGLEAEPRERALKAASWVQVASRRRLHEPVRPAFGNSWPEPTSRLGGRPGSQLSDPLGVC